MNEVINHNPFVGLRPFGSDESLLFFGRQQQTTELLQRLHEHHFMGVVGSSGSGKSSLILAGLIPRLKAGYLVNERDRWLIPVLKPGETPLYNLAAALIKELHKELNVEATQALVQQMQDEGADAIINLLRSVLDDQRSNVFILIDQFEELFRFSVGAGNPAQKNEAIDFVNILLELSANALVPIYVVITMRSDFIGDCSQFYGLPEALNESQYLVPRLTREQLKSAIEGPVRLFGDNINPALTSRLLNDAQTVQDELPLLQHVLMRVWDYEKRTDLNGELDLGDYNAVGGITKALSLHADEALKDMSEQDKHTAKLMLQALTTTDAGGRKIRRPVHLSELAKLTGTSSESIMAIIDHFNEDKRCFLVVNKIEGSDDSLIDISHESLIRQWETLEIWVNEETDSGNSYLRLCETVILHNEGKKDLLSGTELQVALGWRKTFNPTAAWAARYNKAFEESMDFLEKCKVKFDEQELEKATQQKKQLTYKRTRVFLGMTTFLLVLAVVAVIWAIKERYNADEKTKSMETRILVDRLLDRANALLVSDPTIALRLVQEAMKMNTDDERCLGMASEIYLSNQFYKVLLKGDDKLTNLIFSPISDSIIACCSGNDLILIDLAKGNKRTFKGHSTNITSVSFSPDGQKIVTGSMDSTVRIWDINGETSKIITGHNGYVTSVFFSPDGKKIISGSSDGSAILWDLSGKLLQQYRAPGQYIVYCVSISPNGKYVLTGSEDKKARLWDINNGSKPIRECIGHNDFVTAVAFSPDGNSFLTGAGTSDSTALLWNINETEPIMSFTDYSGSVSYVGFSPDGKTILTGANYRSFRLWNLDGKPLKEFKGHTNDINCVAFSPDGKTMVSSSKDSTVRLWAVDIKSTLQEFTGHTGQVESVAFSPDGNYILTGSDDSTSRLWDKNGRLKAVYKDHIGGVTAVAFSPDGKSILSGSDDSTFHLINLDGSIIRSFSRQPEGIYTLAFSPDGKYIVTGGGDGTGRLWDIMGNELAVLRGHHGGISAVVFSPDGQTILTGSYDSTVCLWNLHGQKIKMIGPLSNMISSAVFSPDGRTILTGSYDSAARMWDRDGNLLQEFSDNSNNITAVAFSPDGKTILTGSSNHVLFWSPLGYKIRDFSNINGEINSMVFSPDATDQSNSSKASKVYKTILIGSSDNKARLISELTPLLLTFLNSDKIEKLSEAQRIKYTDIK